MLSAILIKDGAAPSVGNEMKALLRASSRLTLHVLCAQEWDSQSAHDGSHEQLAQYKDGVALTE